MPASTAFSRVSLAAALTIAVAIASCAAYANLSFAVSDQRYFPPFTGARANSNHHLGGEYWNIGKALAAGHGFANPFGEPTGPTAWMPPVLPALLAALGWITEGNRDVVTAVVVVLQVFTLIFTGWLVLALARATLTRLGAWMSAAVYLIAVVSNFHLCFQFTHDCWLVLLTLDLLVAGLYWCDPLSRWKSAAGWGVFGGFCGLVNPIVALAWGGLSLVTAWQQRAWSRFGLTLLFFALTLLPWGIRNYLIFGRLIPVKSNAAYELWQSQCLRFESGLLSPRAFGVHPYVNSKGWQRHEYKVLGEMAFLDKKSDQFWTAVWSDPTDFFDRVCGRFLGATLWYVPFDRAHERQRPVVTWLGRLLHPLPFLGFLVLAGSACWAPLTRVQWLVMGLYFLYLMPYICISYYERYALPLLGVKALLFLWAADRLVVLGRWRTTRNACRVGVVQQTGLDTERD